MLQGPEHASRTREPMLRNPWNIGWPANAPEPLEERRVWQQRGPVQFAWLCSHGFSAAPAACPLDCTTRVLTLLLMARKDWLSLPSAWNVFGVPSNCICQDTGWQLRPN